MSENIKLTKKDFSSDQEIKWCPGCGDYAILAAAQMAMAQIGKPPHEVAVISGIGCSSRFPYYMSTYGMHSIHGRAPAFATGLKLQNPDLSVWLITGDGDGLSIGGNHLAHIIRRNVNINLILFNNEIYGLTKGQYSPTSGQGLNTKSTPYGSVDRPFSPLKFALGAGSSFFARTMDTDPKHMIEVFKAANEHQGTSVIEVYQNCVIFNDKVHDKFTNRKSRDESTVRLEPGKPMVYGKDRNLGLRLEDFELKAGEFKDESELVVHDPSKPSLVHMLSELKDVVPMGVINKVEGQPIYDEDAKAQLEAVKARHDNGKIEDLLYSGDIWEV